MIRDATQAYKKNDTVYGQARLSHEMAQGWLCYLISMWKILHVVVCELWKSFWITAKIGQDWHMNSYDIVKGPSIHRRRVLNHLRKVGYKKRINV